MGREQTEDGKGSSRRLVSGCDIALGTDGGGLNLVSFWVDDAKEATDFLAL